jgi:hypothetical protein
MSVDSPADSSMKECKKRLRRSRHLPLLVEIDLGLHRIPLSDVEGVSLYAHMCRRSSRATIGPAIAESTSSAYATVLSASRV